MMESYFLMGAESQFGMMKSSGDGPWWVLHNSVSVLSAPELYTENG